MNSTGEHLSGGTSRKWLFWGAVALVGFATLFFIPIVTCPECNGTKASTIANDRGERGGPCGGCRSKGRLSLYSRFLNPPDPPVW
jgi:hypothetical protein